MSTLNDHLMLVPTRASIERLEAEVSALPQLDLMTEHALSGGVYARTIYMPEGCVLTGAVHKKDHINVIVGDITAWTEAGMKRFTGHHVIRSKAGAKRAGYAHAPTIWTTVCETALVDIAAIENELVEEPEKLQTRQGLGFFAAEKLEA